MQRFPGAIFYVQRHGPHDSHEGHDLCDRERQDSQQQQFEAKSRTKSHGKHRAKIKALRILGAFSQMECAAVHG